MPIWIKWILPGLISISALTGGAALIVSDRVESDLSSKAEKSLRSDHPWAEVSVEGRDLTLSGTAPSQEAADAAVELAANANGVRDVVMTGDLLPVVSPYEFSAEKSDKKITLSGNAPTIQAREALLQAAKKADRKAEIVDQISLAAGAPNEFEELAGFSLSLLKGFSDGEVSLNNDSLEVSGTAESSGSFEEVLEKLEGEIPGGGKLAANDLVAPIADPFEWKAEYDGKEAILGGFATSRQEIENIKASLQEILPGKKVFNRMRIASGEPEGFSESVKQMLDLFPHFKEGKVALSGKNLSLSGVAKSAADQEKYLEKVGNLPGGFVLAQNSVEPAIANPYRWSVTKGEQGIVLEGHVPSEEDRKAILEVVRSELGSDKVIDRQKPAAGAPEGIAEMRQILIGFISRISAGQGNMINSVASLSGRVETEELAAQIDQEFSDKLPVGFTGSTNLLVVGPASVEQNDDGQTQQGSSAAISSSGVVGGTVAIQTDGNDAAASAITELPIANPYRWSISKIPTGITILGNVANEEAGARVLKMVQDTLGTDSVDNRLVSASGAPEGFEEVLQTVVGQVKLLEAGQGNVIGNRVSVTGRVKNANLRNLIDRNIMNRLPDGYQGTTNIVFPQSEVIKAEPVGVLPPVAKPFRWSISKLDGKVTVSGSIADETSANAVIELVKSTLGIDSVEADQSPARGKPAGFNAAQALLIRQMKLLEEGTGTITDQSVEITGRVKNKNLGNLIGRTIENKLPQGFAGLTEVSAPETEVVVAKPVELVSQDAQRCQADIVNAISGRKIQFETNRAIIRSDSTAVLNDVAKVAIDCPEFRIEIGGHTDSRGKDEYNHQLSEGRAKAVVHYMVNAGVVAERLEVVGYGESSPIASNDTGEGRSQNRRIEFKVIE